MEQKEIAPVDLCAAALESNIVSVFHEKTEYKIVLTGETHYKTFWVRDFCMSVPGLLELGKKREVKDSIDLILKLRRSDGLVPRIIDSKWLSYKIRFILNMIGINPDFGGKIVPTYLSEHGVVSVDGNILTVIAAAAYIRKTSDREQARLWLPEMLKLIDYIDFFHKNGLIHQDEHSDWQDSLKRCGRVSFANALYAIALKEMCWVQEFIGVGSSKLTKRYIDFLYEFKTFFLKNNKIINFEDDNREAIDSTLLCLFYDVFPAEESSSIFKEIKRSGLWTPFPGRLTREKYPNNFKSWTTRIAGISDYHENLYWPWITALAGIVSLKLKDYTEADKILIFLTKIYSKDGKINEVYENKSDESDNSDHINFYPVKRILAKSESGFTWSAAMSLKFFSEHLLSKSGQLGKKKFE